MFKSLVCDLISQERLEAFGTDLKSFLLNAQLDQIEGNPGKVLTAIVKSHILDPALSVLQWTGTAEAQALYDSFVDTKLYGTGCAQAAEDAGTDPVDLAWLISQAQEIDKDKLNASTKLKKRRNKKSKS